MPHHKINDGTGFSMHYEIHPGLVTESVLFIHGNLASNRWWHPAVEVWKNQSQNKSGNPNLKGSLILAEFRGCGQSSAPVQENEINVHTFANDYISLVRSLNLPSVHLVGHSTGGLIAALMMAKEPKMFGRAVLLDPVGATGVQFDNSMIAAFEQMKTDKNLLGLVMGSTIFKNDPTNDYFKNAIVEDAFRAVNTVGHLVLKCLEGLDVRSQLSEVQNQVLILHGDQDQVLKLSDSRELARILPHAEFRVIPDHGHSTNMESPELFVRITSDFLF